MNFMNDVFCIHVAHQNDRKTNTIHEFQTHFPDTRLHFFNAVVDHENPARGCGTSFCNCIQEHALEQREHIIICEDDVQFVPGARQKIIDALNQIPSDADIVLGGSYNLQNSLSRKKACPPHFMRIGDYASHHFVLFRKRAYAHVLQYLSQTKYSHFDRFIGQCLSHTGILNVYTIWPMPVRQRDGYSSILQQNTQYNTIEWARRHCLLWYVHEFHHPYRQSFEVIHTQSTLAREKYISDILTVMKRYKIYIESNKLQYKDRHLPESTVSLWDAEYWSSQMDVHEDICFQIYGIRSSNLADNHATSASQYSITFS